MAFWSQHFPRIFHTSAAWKLRRRRGRLWFPGLHPSSEISHHTTSLFAPVTNSTSMQATLQYIQDKLFLKLEPQHYRSPSPSLAGPPASIHSLSNLVKPAPRVHIKPDDTRADDQLRRNCSILKDCPPSSSIEHERRYLRHVSEAL